MLGGPCTSLRCLLTGLEKFGMLVQLVPYNRLDITWKIEVTSADVASDVYESLPYQRLGDSIVVGQIMRDSISVDEGG